MSIPYLEIPYAYPAPTLAEAIASTNNNVAIKENPTIKDVYDKYNGYFNETNETNGTYVKIRNKLLDQLNDILGKTTEASKLKIADLDTNAFYTEAQTFDGKRIDNDHCREGFMAYRFYLKEIATRITAINKSIKDGQDALAKLTELTGNFQEINNQAHAYITKIEICDKFIYEKLKEFLTYYKFNEDTKQWDITTLDVFETDNNFSQNYAWSQLGEYNDYKNLLWYSWENKQWVLLNDFKSYEETTNGETFGYKVETTNGNEGEPQKIYKKSTELGYTVWESATGNNIKIRYYNNGWQCYKLAASGGSGGTWESANLNDIKDKFSGFTATSDGKIVPKESKAQTPRIQSKLQNLRELQIETTNSLNTNGKGSMQLTSFNSLTLFDRLRYIRWYYKLMFSQTDGVDRTGSRFPDKNDTGYPCMPDIPSIDDTKATQSLGALELFYVGYLINRDGPVNALSSFFEVKVNALRENVSLSSKKIEALNIYLDFINEGLNQINKNNKFRATDGSIIALTYLCGQKMYNLYEDEKGDKYLVLPSLVNNGQYFLVKADENGRKWLIGDANNYELTDSNQVLGNCGCYVLYANGLWHAKLATNHGTIKTCGEGGEATAYCKYDAPSKHTTKTITNFKLPTQLECTTVAPSSVLGYAYATGNQVDNKDFFEEDVADGNGTKNKCFKLVTDSKNGNTTGSWTDAFSRKTQYINTAIDTTNTDVTLDRSKIDTFDSLTSTFRSRAQDTYQNIISNIR